MKKFLISLIFLIFNSTHVVGEIINKFQISGNYRISDETIILFSGLKLNDDINENDLNKVFKNLYETSFFKDLNLSISNNTLIIQVDENPLIQSIDIQGIKKIL